MFGNFSFIAILVAGLYLAAMACIYRILLTYRTAQGALAWIIALLGLPYVAVPLFVLIGRNRFGGYVKARRMGDRAISTLIDQFEQQTTSIRGQPLGTLSDELDVLCKLNRQPFTDGNHCTLLKDGEATSQALFDDMEDARHYILLEFYICLLYTSPSPRD